MDPQSLSKRRPPAEALHLNVRVTGDDALIFEHLRRRTGNITDSLRVRDAVRTAVYLLAMREKGDPITTKDPKGRDVDILDYLGVFFPEGGPPLRKTR